MKKARIALFEDEPHTREEVGFLLDILGHGVAVEASTVEESLDVLSRIATGEVSVDAIALDGNLGPRKYDCADAKTIYGKMQELGLMIPIIGFSGYDLAEHGIPVLADVYKNGSALADELDRLPPAA
jgi:hypothetical protein